MRGDLDLVGGADTLLETVSVRQVVASSGDADDATGADSSSSFSSDSRLRLRVVMRSATGVSVTSSPLPASTLSVAGAACGSGSSLLDTAVTSEAAGTASPGTD